MSDSEAPWTVTYQTPPSMGFSRQEYWSGFPFPSPGDLPFPEVKLASLVSRAFGTWILYYLVTRKVFKVNCVPLYSDSVRSDIPSSSNVLAKVWL